MQLFRGRVGRQARSRRIIGAIQVQAQGSMFYVSLLMFFINTTTFWYTAGYQITLVHFQWFEMWMLYVLLVVVLVIVGFIDWKFVLPSRQNFVNEQACKHDNPAMDSLRRIEEKLTELEKRLDEK